MKNRRSPDSLLKALSRDPRLRRAISKSKRMRRKNRANREDFADLLFLSLGAIARFVSKKKARELDDLLAIAYLLVRASLLVKENIFDRPEVKEFFNRQSNKVASMTRSYVNMILAKAGNV